MEHIGRTLQRVGPNFGKRGAGYDRAPADAHRDAKFVASRPVGGSQFGKLYPRVYDNGIARSGLVDSQQQLGAVELEPAPQQPPGSIVRRKARIAQHRLAGHAKMKVRINAGASLLVMKQPPPLAVARFAQSVHPGPLPKTRAGRLTRVGNTGIRKRGTTTVRTNGKPSQPRSQRSTGRTELRILLF